MSSAASQRDGTQHPNSPTAGNGGILASWPATPIAVPQNAQPQSSTAAPHTPEPAQGGKELWRHRHAWDSAWELGEPWGWGAGTQQCLGGVGEHSRVSWGHRALEVLLAPPAAGIRVDGCSRDGAEGGAEGMARLPEAPCYLQRFIWSMR